MIVSKNEYWANEAAKCCKKEIKIEYATVIQLTPAGDPIIQFSGDPQPSKKIYVRLKSYQPAIGDRIQIIDGVIQGGWSPK